MGNCMYPSTQVLQWETMTNSFFFFPILRPLAVTNQMSGILIRN
jgi:hypothetical protein